MKKVMILVSCVTLGACTGTNSDKNTQTTATEVQMGEVINLLKPADNGTSLHTALEKRHSVRAYSDQALTLEQLSGVMWAAAGQNRENGKLTAPSAMALYPIKVYAVFPQGVYLYDSAAHKLTRVTESNLMELSGQQPFVAQAAMNIMYIADLGQYEQHMERMGEEMAVRMCFADAAGYAQNVNLYAAANGLGAVTRGGAQGAEFLKITGAPDNYMFILAQTVGIPQE